MYGMTKVHRKVPNSQMTLYRPVKPEIVSPYFVMSKYVDNYKKILCVPSFVRNLEDIGIGMSKVQLYDPMVAGIDNLDTLSMYPIIDEHNGLHCVTNYMIYFKHEIGEKYHTNIITDILTLIMKKSIFKFRSSWWFQLSDTTIETPCTCTYALLFFAW